MDELVIYVAFLHCSAVGLYETLASRASSVEGLDLVYVAPAIYSDPRPYALAAYLALTSSKRVAEKIYIEVSTRLLRSRQIREVQKALQRASSGCRSYVVVLASFRELEREAIDRVVEAVAGGECRVVDRVDEVCRCDLPTLPRPSTELDPLDQISVVGLSELYVH